MSKFFLSNSASLFNRIKKGVEASPYKVSLECSKDGVFALSTQKLVVDNTNGLNCIDGFIIITGTMVWGEGERINSASLANIYQLFKGDINEIRNHSIGNYAACIMKDGKLFVFGEASGFYNIYYYFNDSKEWIISNSLFDLAVVLKDHLSINTMALTESTVQDGILWGDTYFNEIHRLNGLNFLVVDNHILSVIDGDYTYPMPQGYLEDSVKRYSELAKSYARKIVKAYGDPTISMTGGLDSRIVLSSYLAVDSKPHLFYGTGNSFITNTYEEDKVIDQEFSNKYNLILHEENWSTPMPVDKYWKKYLQYYGFSYDVYAASESVMEAYKNTPTVYFTLGQVGELLRNLPWIESRGKDYFTLDEYVNDFYVDQVVKNEVVNIDEYLVFIRTKLMSICKYYKIDINHISNEEIFFLSLERRKTADALVLNLVNFMKYCSYSSLAEYECMVAGRVASKDLDNSGFMLRCLDALCPSVLDVPVFSHCTMRRFYKETMSLSPQNQAFTYKEKLKGFLRNYVHWLWLFARKVFPRKKWRYPIDASIYERLISLVKKYDDLKVIHTYKLDDTRRTINYVMKEYAIKQISNVYKLQDIQANNQESSEGISC